MIHAIVGAVSLAAFTAFVLGALVADAWILTDAALVRVAAMHALGRFCHRRTKMETFHITQIMLTLKGNSNLLLEYSPDINPASRRLQIIKEATESGRNIHAIRCMFIIYAPWTQRAAPKIDTSSWLYLQPLAAKIRRPSRRDCG